MTTSILAPGKKMSAHEMLAQLVAFRTVSSASNLELIEFVRTYLAGHGIKSTLVPSEDGEKANLYATIGPRVPGGVVLSGHTDVVPADQTGWTSDPWTLVARDRRLYGRGTCDMKGFNALVLAAVPDMVAAGLKSPIHIALSYDEEVGCKGAPAMVREMAERLPPPRAVIVGEPTRMRLVTGHKSSLSFFTIVRGHSVHSSRVDQGVSAVMVAARLVTWLEDAMLESRRNADPDEPFKPPYTTLHCGTISGGTAANVVADSCRFVTDVRALPSEDPFDYKMRYEAFIREEIEPHMKRVAPQTGVDIVQRGFVAGLRPETAGLADTLVNQICMDRAGESVVSYGTEAGIFQQAGWSTVVFGPGDIAQAHTADEYLDEREFSAGESFIRRLIERLAR